MEWLVAIHSYWRYLVVLVALGAFVVSLMAYLGSRPWDSLADRLSLVFTIVMDVQLLIGVLVWLLADYPQTDTFLRWLHPLLMIAAVALAHVGRVRSDRANDPRGKGAQASLFFGLSLVLMLIAIPLGSWLAPAK